MTTATKEAAHELAAGFSVVRSGASVAPLAERRLLGVRGSDRTTFLQGMLSNEVAALSEGQGTAALLLTDQGRVVADLRVYALADEIWLDAPHDARGDVRASLERYIVADDVEIDDRAEAGLAVRGPSAATVVARAAAVDVGEWEECRQADVSVSGQPARLVRSSDLGVDGFHLWMEPGACEQVRAALVEAGAVAVSPGALEAQRVVAGISRLGAEFGRETLAPEIPSLEPAISLRKGCYLGQEVVERIAARGHVNWKIAVLRGNGMDVGDAVSVGGDEIGRITSAVQRPDDGAVWGLARVRAAHTDVGTSVIVGHRGEATPAEIVAPSPSDP